MLDAYLRTIPPLLNVGKIPPGKTVSFTRKNLTVQLDDQRTPSLFTLREKDPQQMIVFIGQQFGRFLNSGNQLV